jgi:hypothetical protein
MSNICFFLFSAKQVAVSKTAVWMAPIYIAMDTTVVAYKSMVPICCKEALK